MIGAGSGTLLDELIGEESSAAKDGWRRHFEALKGEIRPLPGAADLLRAVAGRGVAVMLATSSEPEDVEALREAIDADDAITGVTSAGDVDEAKPSPAVFEAALEQAGVGPDRAIVVGDSAWDIKAARRAGMDCVMLLSGGNGRCELEEAGGLAGYEDPADLLAHLDESPLARLWH